MYGAKYQWILAAKYVDNWWNVGGPSTVRCTASQLKQVLEGIISTDILVLSSSNERTIGGYVRINLCGAISPTACCITDSAALLWYGIA